MNFRKIVSTAIIAAMFFWAPSIIPARAVLLTGCGYFTGTMRLIPTDTAFAGLGGVYVPCPPPPGSPPIPWVGIYSGPALLAFS